MKKGNGFAVQQREALKRAVKAAGGKKAFLDRLDIDRQLLDYWLKVGIPPRRVLTIEALSGVSRHELSPTLYPKETGEGA